MTNEKMNMETIAKQAGMTKQTLSIFANGKHDNIGLEKFRSLCNPVQKKQLDAMIRCVRARIKYYSGRRV